MTVSTTSHRQSGAFKDFLSEPVRNGIYKTKEFHGKGQKIVNMGELFAYNFIADQDMKRVELNKKEMEKALLQNGDLLFARRSLVLEGSGKCSLVTELNEPTTFESSIIRARLNRAKADPRFFFYFFTSPKGRGSILAIASRTAVSGIKGSSLQEIPIDVPDIVEQQKISAVLSTFDDLIENNSKRIKILEDMTQMIYREWFVHYRFPNHENVKMVDSGTELGEVPEGWEVHRVEDLVKRIPVGQKYDSKSVQAEGTIPVLDQGKSGVIGYHNDEPGLIASIDDPVIVFANHTCYQKIIHFPFSAIQNVLPFISSDAIPRNIYWLHYATNKLVTFNDYKGHWPEFMSKKCVVPTAKIADHFGRLIQPISVLVYTLEKSNAALKKARDLILPKLISGQLSVA